MRRFFTHIAKGLKALALIAGISSIPATSLYAQVKPAVSWKATDDDALLFDLRSGRYSLGDGIRGYQTDVGVCVDFADVIMALDLPVRLDKKSRRATGWLFQERRTITIDRDTNAVQIVNKKISLKKGDIYDTPEGWCIATKTLASWLAVELDADMSNALLLIKSETKLPFELAAERRARAAKVRPRKAFDLASLPQAKQPYKLWRTPSIDAVISVGGLNDRNVGQRFDARYELYASGEIGKASFDARLSSDDKGLPQNLRVRAYRTDPKAKLLGPLKATHVALGDVSMVSTPLVSQSSVGRGGFITNRPVDRPENFDRTSFRGELPAGWDAELYRNDQLLAFAETRPDGRYEFLDVPLLYGQNRFEVVLHGPQGQIKRDVQNIPVGLDSIPPKKTYYWAGVHEAGADLINLRGATFFRNGGWRGGVGVERGLNKKTSAALSLYSLQIDGVRRNYLETSVRRAVGPALTEFSAASDLGGGMSFRGQLLGQIKNTFIRAETIWATGGFSSDRLERDVNGRHSLSLDHSFKLGGKTVPVHLDGRYTTRTTGNDTIDVAARISYNLRNLSLTGEVLWERDKRVFGPDPPDRLEVGLRASGRIGKVRLRGEARYRLSPDKRFDRATVIAEWRAGDRADWRAELGYDAPLNRGRVGFGYIRHFDKFALTATAEAATDGSVAAGLNLSFSIGPDPRNGKVRFSSQKLGSSGQAMAVVYRDKNGDGIRQDDEPFEENVELTAGLTTALTATDKNGRAIIDSLQPFRPVLIGIDASSLSDPFVQPALPGVVVTPRPGIAARVELPLVSAGEIDGTLVRSGGGSLSGVDLELIDQAGRTIATTRTEFDGFFLFEKVPYGKYRIGVGKLSAAAAKISPLLGVSADVNDENPLVNLGAVATNSTTRIASNAGED